MIQKLISAGEDRIAIRYSEVEPIALGASFVGKVKWLWVDCFTKYPDISEATRDVLNMFKVCLVSPTLQGRPTTEWQAGLHLVPFDAVCEKLYNAKYWLKDVDVISK